MVWTLHSQRVAAKPIVLLDIIAVVGVLVVVMLLAVRPMLSKRGPITHAELLKRLTRLK